MEWISVKDRLPNISDECLVVRVFKDMPEGRNKDVSQCWFNGFYFFYENGDIATEEDGISITHWMNLPEPPKE